MHAANFLRRFQRSVPEADASQNERPSLSSPKNGIAVGTLQNGSKQKIVQVDRSQIISKHLHCVGSTGSGKTAWAVSLIRQIIDNEIPLILIDAKGDLFETVMDSVTDLIVKTDNNLLSQVRTFDVFSSSHLIPWNLCARIDSESIDVQAYELGHLILQTIQTDVGIHQGRFLHNFLSLCIELGVTLPEGRSILTNPQHLAALVSRSKQVRIRHYFIREFPQESKVTRHGVLARLDALLRLPSWRAMLGCKQEFDFKHLFEKGITLISIGNAPLGCRDLQTFAGRMIFLRLARALMSRPVMANILPIAIFIDEAQELISPQIVEEMERLLTLARSRKVSLALFHQQIEQLEKISPSLPKILRTNCGTQAIFRSSIEAGRHFSHILPVTGKALRPDYRPDHRSSRNPYFSRSEELHHLVGTIPNLPLRNFYLWRAGSGPAHLLRTLDVPLNNGSNLLVKILIFGKKYIAAHLLFPLKNSMRKQVTRNIKKQVYLNRRILNFLYRRIWRDWGNESF